MTDIDLGLRNLAHFVVQVLDLYGGSFLGSAFASNPPASTPAIQGGLASKREFHVAIYKSRATVFCARIWEPALTTTHIDHGSRLSVEVSFGSLCRYLGGRQCCLIFSPGSFARLRFQMPQNSDAHPD